MTPDRLVGDEKERRKQALLATISGLSKIASMCQQGLEPMIKSKKRDWRFPEEILGQTEEIAGRLGVLSRLLIDFSQNPTDFSLIHNRVARDSEGAEVCEVVFRKRSELAGPGLYFRGRSGRIQRVYAAALGPGQLNPFGDGIAVPEISLWPSKQGGVKYGLILLLGRQKRFTFDPGATRLVSQEGIGLLSRFVIRDYAVVELKK